MVLAFVIGVALGFFGSIPAAGPLALLIVQAGLDGARSRSLALAVGGAVAEGLWAMAAASGLGLLMTARPELEHGLRGVGSALTVLVGVALMLAARRPVSVESPPPGSPLGFFSGVLAGFALVAFNPSFLATWTLSCAVLRSRPSVASVVEPARAPVLALGAAAGVVGWFLVLGAVVRRHRRRLSALRVWLLRGLGLALVIAGVAWHRR